MELHITCIWGKYICKQKRSCGVFSISVITCFIVMLKSFINSSVADSTHKSLASKPDCVLDGSHN